MGVFTYKEVQDVLFKEKKRHQDLLREAGTQTNEEYSRHAVFIISDLQRDLKKLFLDKYS